MPCVNKYYSKDALSSVYSIYVNIDGDFVCDQSCKLEYEKQKDYFGSIVYSSEKIEAWLLGND